MIKEFFSTNIWLKLMSLAVAIALWFFVIISSQTQTVVEVPIKFINMPEGLEVIVAPDTVSVGIEGYKRVVERLKKEDISVVLDMSEAKRGRNIFPLSENNVNLPHSLEVKSIFPQTISLMLQESS
jgi:YbbR domain-containing protein